jgi:hypothetical protein
VIKSAKEHQKPKEPGASVIEIRLTPELGESPEEFKDRIEKLVNGVHLTEFKRLSAGEYQLLIALNPSWEEPEEFDATKLSRADLLNDLAVDPQSDRRHKTNVDY